jgi:two-component system response regulator AtoC
LLRTQRWPGNVRQLQNLIERLVVLTDGPAIGVGDVQRELGEAAHFATQSIATAANPANGTLDGEVLRLDDDLRAAEKRALVRALEHTRGNRTLAARLLGISRATLYNKLAEHGIG